VDRDQTQGLNGNCCSSSTRNEMLQPCLAGPSITCSSPSKAPHPLKSCSTYSHSEFGGRRLRPRDIEQSEAVLHRLPLRKEQLFGSPSLVSFLGMSVGTSQVSKFQDPSFMKSSSYDSPSFVDPGNCKSHGTVLSTVPSLSVSVPTFSSLATRPLYFSTSLDGEQNGDTYTSRCGLKGVFGFGSPRLYCPSHTRAGDRRLLRFVGDGQLLNMPKFTQCHDKYANFFGYASRHHCTTSTSKVEQSFYFMETLCNFGDCSLRASWEGAICEVYSLVDKYLSIPMVTKPTLTNIQNEQFEGVCRC
jgi:hypothetical protein